MNDTCVVLHKVSMNLLMKAVTARNFLSVLYFVSIMIRCKPVFGGIARSGMNSLAIAATA